MNKSLLLLFVDLTWLVNIIVAIVYDFIYNNIERSTRMLLFIALLYLVQLIGWRNISQCISKVKTVKFIITAVSTTECEFVWQKYLYFILVLHMALTLVLQPISESRNEIQFVREYEIWEYDCTDILFLLLLLLLL